MFTPQMFEAWKALNPLPESNSWQDMNIFGRINVCIDGFESIAKLYNVVLSKIQESSDRLGKMNIGRYPVVIIAEQLLVNWSDQLQLIYKVGNDKRKHGQVHDLIDLMEDEMECTIKMLELFANVLTGINGTVTHRLSTYRG